MKLRIKYLIERVLSLFLKLFNIFPLKNRVVISSFSGRQYSDSPRRISEHLKKNEPELEQVWAFTEPDKFSIDGVKKVRYKSLEYLFYVLTSKIYVDNVEPWSLLRFRKGQLVVETWHGGGAYKSVGSDRLDIDSLEKQHVIDKMNRINLFLSSSQAFTDFVIKGAYQYKGKILPVGLPRNDELAAPSPELRKEVKDKLGISENKHIVIYAPTFRNSRSTDIYNIDYAALRKALETRFGGEWVILLRFHYYMSKDLKVENGIVNVSDYPDMQELLQASDVLITDYSSTIWDFSLMNRPCFLYAVDIGDYNGERAFYTPIESWPFPLARNNGELVKAVTEFDGDKYIEDVKKHHDSLGSCETGKATEAVCKEIIEFLRG